MAIDAASIGALVGRFSNKLVHKQALMSFDALEAGEVQKDDKPTQRGTVNIKAGGLSSTGLIADDGTLPSGASLDITQLTYDPCWIFGRLRIPRGGAVISNNPEDGVDVVMEQMESVGRDLGRHLGRVFYKSKLEDIATASSNTSTSATGVFSSIDASGYRIGMTVEQRDSSGDLVQTFTIDDITLDADGTNGASITTSADFSATALADGDDLYVKGSYANTFVSLDDAADSSTTVYGQAATALEWKGNEDSTTTTLTAEKLHDLIVNVNRRGDEKPSCLIMNPLNEARLYETMDDEIRYVGNKMDQYGLQMTFKGLKVCVDRNVPDTHIFVHNKRAARLHQFREFGPDFDGGKKPGMSRGAVIVSDTTFSYDVQLFGGFQGRFLERRCLGKLSALTA